MHAFVAESRLAEPARHREAQHVRPPARGVRFIPRGHVRRTHRPVERLPARAEPAAHVHGAAHAVEGRIVEEGVGLRRVVAGPEPQVGGERGCIHDLSGVEDPVRIERSLHGAKRLVENRPEHLAHERASHQPVAVLARQRAAEFEHQVRHLVRDRLERADTIAGLHVDDGTDVQAADRRVRIHAGGRAVAADDGEETIDVVAQPLGRDGCVLDE